MTLLREYEPTSGLQIEILPSLFLTGLVLLLHIFALSCVFLLDQCTLFFKLCFTLFGCLHAYWVIKKECLRTHFSSIVYCQQNAFSHWRLRTRAGKTLCAKLISHYRSPGFIALSFKILPQEKPLSLFLARDALTQQNYSLLLYRLWNQ